MINDLIFKGVKCPYCNNYFTIEYLKWYLIDISNVLNKKGELWRNSLKYKKSLLYKPVEKRYYMKNVYNKMIHLIRNIQKRRNMDISSLIYNHYDQINQLDFNNNYHELLGNTKYYGYCQGCSEDPLQKKSINYSDIKIKSVRKECVNAQNELVILEPNMFSCTVCKSYEENYRSSFIMINLFFYFYIYHEFHLIK